MDLLHHFYNKHVCYSLCNTPNCTLAVPVKQCGKGAHSWRCGRVNIPDYLDKQGSAPATPVLCFPSHSGKHCPHYLIINFVADVNITATVIVSNHRPTRRSKRPYASRKRVPRGSGRSAGQKAESRDLYAGNVQK